MNAQTPTRSIQIIFHVVQAVSGGGPGTEGYVLTDSVTQALKLLNDAYRAKPNTIFSASTDTRYEFVLAPKDPNGNTLAEPGIDRIANHPEWFHLATGVTSPGNDQLGANVQWDQSKYLNIITHGEGNWAALPWYATLNPNRNGVRFWWGYVGGYRAAQDWGRVLVHEVSHMLGLYHEASNFCSPTCNWDHYSSGDYIADTPLFTGCNLILDYDCANPPIPPFQQCGIPLFPNTFMGVDPTCWVKFTPEQTARMRCSVGRYPQSVPYLGIVESSIQTTVTTLCDRGNSYFRFTATWQTNKATTGTNSDSLQVYLPGYSGSCTDGPWTYAAATPNGVNHSITIQRPCTTTGTFKFNIRSRDGVLSTRSLCRTFVVNSCPSCPPCDPPCELE